MSEEVVSKPEVETVHSMRIWWWGGLFAALVGVTLTVTQVMEKIAKLKNPQLDLACDVNSKLSCSTVLDTWQSSVLGIPNAIVGLILFTAFATALLASLTHSHLSKGMWKILWPLSVVFAFFSTWFMAQTAFVISAMCLWCAFITTAVLTLLLVVTRSAVNVDAFGYGIFGQAMASLIRSKQDIILVVLWWGVIALALFLGLVVI